MNDFLLNYLATIAGVILAFAYTPQIYKTYKTKSVEGISLGFWIVLNIALTLLLINSIAVFINTGVYGYMIVEILNESLAFIMLCLVLKYRNK